MGLMRFTTQIALHVRDLVEQATDDRLQGVIDECGVLTETNCDWLEYRLKDAVEIVAINEIQLRKDTGLPPVGLEGR